MESCSLLATANCYVPAMSRPKPDQIATNPRLAFPFRRKGRNSFFGRCSCNGAEILKAKAKGFETDMDREKNEKCERKEWIHFVGIGGSGLSALAMLALKQGFEVSGSDIMWSSFMDELQKAGARIYVGHSISNLESITASSLPNAVVISSAIPVENEEVAYAKLLGIPIYKRDSWLRRITEHYNLIAISGTHGKSTTAAMLSYVLSAMGDDLVAVVGANVPQFKEGNIIPGRGPNFVLEADEYDCCFLGLSPSVAVVTNVEWDHVDIFQDEEAVLNIFRRFVQKVKVGGHLILCGDSAGAYSLVSEFVQEGVSDSEIVPASLVSDLGYGITTYGISSKNDWYALSITPNSQGGQDYVLYHKEFPVANISLALPGVHNVLNSLAVIATVATLVHDRMLNDTISSVADHLSKFKGVSRRFELVGTINKCHIYDDYAHHPTEVRAALQAARQRFPHHAIWIVFQPHTFSRLAALMKDFTTAFTAADHVIITEIYAARELNEWNSDGRELASLIKGPLSEYIPKMEDVVDKLVEILSDRNQETVVLTLGAGDITTLGPKLLRRLQAKVIKCVSGLWYGCLYFVFVLFYYFYVANREMRPMSSQYIICSYFLSAI